MNSSDDASTARGDPAEHVAPLEPNTVTAGEAIAKALSLLAPGARHSEVPAILFDNRVAPFTVRAWRMGMRSMPPWARDMLTAKLEAGARRYAAAAAITASSITGRGNNWDPTGATLRAWRQARRQSS